MSKNPLLCVKAFVFLVVAVVVTAGISWSLAMVFVWACHLAELQVGG